MRRLIFPLIVTVVSTFLASGFAAPVAIYHMDESSGTIANSYGSNDGTFNGSADDYGQPSPFTTALRFRGGQEVDCGNGFDLNDRSFTIEAWVRPDSSRNSQELIASKPEGGNLSGQHLHGQIDELQV